MAAGIYIRQNGTHASFLPSCKSLTQDPGVGEVVAVGAGVTSPAIGSRVGIKYAADACLNCEIVPPDRCLQGGESSCAEVKLSGYFTPGTFQQYCLSTARYVTPVPDSLDSAQAAPLMCGGLTVYTALKRAEARHGDWVVVAGAGGGLGHLAIQYARTLGCRVLAMDLGAKEKFCRDLGADEFVDFTTYPTEGGLSAAVKDITGGGARIVLMCSSNKKAYVQAPTWLGFRGKLACLGVPECSSVFIADVDPLLVDELTIFGVKTGNRLEAKECLEIAARGSVKTHFQLRRMRSLTKIFTEMESGAIQGRVVIDLK
ncbi:Alcohol dehydrogenase [Colletotrichum higginsianum IMI 349063]|uniref:Alcohol dehydrogenase n=1 Tax=Colletotrichum higginsianum (strain IMI 349063) TaxID=759273 RepID=A0A1B7XY91_COLHI|nr:Alcohol dehydrogenase [Colletotrichum higginsianum IMI 349063]OBR04738.1 Alcohol dehydrogenase [Colletotrichum higginsianum IMI 349063]